MGKVSSIALLKVKELRKYNPFAKCLSAFNWNELKLEFPRIWMEVKPEKNG